MHTQIRRMLYTYTHTHITTYALIRINTCPHTYEQLEQLLSDMEKKDAELQHLRERNEALTSDLEVCACRVLMLCMYACMHVCMYVGAAAFD